MSEAAQLVAIVGPTAVGKTALAMRLARQLDAEIVSADSRQVYRHMDIGTAKPSVEQRRVVPHHLIDVVDPDEEYSLALFLRQASSVIQEIRSSRRLPILVGGTGQYVWGILEGWQVPTVPPDQGLRATLEARAGVEGPQALYQELHARDPDAARRIDSRNTRRVIRALEVFLYDAKGAASRRSKEPPSYEVVAIGLTLDRVELYERIDGRVDAMMRAGWVREVEALLARGYGTELPSMSGLGYKELAQHLAVETSLDEAVSAIKRRTKKFARRQYTWFKPTDERIRWFDASPDGLDAAVAEVIRAVREESPSP